MNQTVSVTKHLVLALLYIEVLVIPNPVESAGRAHLIYELHITVDKDLLRK